MEGEGEGRPDRRVRALSLPGAVASLAGVLLLTPIALLAQGGAGAGPRPVPWPTDAGPGPAIDVAPSTLDARGLPRRGPGFDPLQVDSDPSAARLAVGGMLGGGVGFFGLGALGAWVADETADPGHDLAAVGGFVLGGMVGEILGVAAGVHRADGGRGSFWADLTTSGLVAAGALGALALADADGAPAWALAGLGAAAQVALTVRTEIGGR